MEKNEWAAKIRGAEQAQVDAAQKVKQRQAADDLARQARRAEFERRAREDIEPKMLKFAAGFNEAKPKNGVFRARVDELVDQGWLATVIHVTSRPNEAAYHFALQFMVDDYVHFHVGPAQERGSLPDPRQGWEQIPVSTMSEAFLETQFDKLVKLVIEGRYPA